MPKKMPNVPFGQRNNSGGGKDFQEIVDKLLPGAGRHIFIIVIIVILFLWVLYNSFTVYIKPYEWGVKEVKVPIFGKRGMNEKAYEAGLHLLAPFGLEIMHKLPRHLLLLDITNERRDYTALGRVATRKESAVRIETSDGFYVYADVSILFRIDNPYLAITTLGPGKEIWDNGIIPKAEPFIKKVLGEFSSEQFYDSKLRYAQSRRLKDLLHEELKPKGIEIKDTLVRYIKYSPEYDRQLKGMKLEDQLKLTNIAKTAAQKEKAEYEKMKKKGEADKEVKLKEGAAYKLEKEADIERYKRIKYSDGDREVALAQAYKEKLVNDAYMTVGSEIRVALEQAKAFESIDLIITNKQENILDYNYLMGLFNLKKY
ncbi:MAG: SPFH domain-containing protein [bacterium]